MNLVQLFRLFYIRRWLLIGITFACLFGAITIARLVPPRYEATSRVMLDIIKPDPVTGEVIASGAARAYVKTQIELIKDYRIAGKVVDDLGWTNSADFSAAYNARSRPDSRDFRRWLAQQVIDGTNAELIDASNILEIKFDSNSPEAAAKVADAVRQAYVGEAVALKREAAVGNAAWFAKQAIALREKLTAAEKKKADFERSSGIILQENNVDTDTTRLAALAQSAPAQGTTTVGGGVTRSQGPSAQLSTLTAAIANAQRELGPNNPQLQSLLKQRDALAAAETRSAGVSMPRTVQSGPSISSLISAQRAKVLAQQEKVSEAKQLASDVSVLRDQYAKTSARALELEQQGQSTESGLTLLGDATAPMSAVFPKWPLVIFGAIALGLVLGILVSILAELLARRVRGVEDLRIDDLPVLGIMARVKPAHKRRFSFGNFIPWLRPALQE